MLVVLQRSLHAAVRDGVDHCPAAGAPDDEAAAVCQRLDAGGAAIAVVTDESDVVVGVARAAALRNARRVEEAMEPGPTTVRADEPLDDLRERLRATGQSEVFVTDPDGRFLGVILQAEV